jgi:hypothetical protein
MKIIPSATTSSEITIFKQQHTIPRRNSKQVIKEKKKIDENWEVLENENEEAANAAYKLVAFTAVGFSLFAVISVAICMPIVYNFVEHIQRQTRRELDSCKVL